MRAVINWHCPLGITDNNYRVIAYYYLTVNGETCFAYTSRKTGPWWEVPGKVRCVRS